MAWDADSLNKIAGALNDAYSPDQVFRALDFTGHTERECGEHRTTGPRAWCHDCTEWCYPEGPCKGCELPQLRANVAELKAENERLRAVTIAARRVAGYEFSIERHRPLTDALAALDAADDRTDR